MSSGLKLICVLCALVLFSAPVAAVDLVGERKHGLHIV